MRMNAAVDRASDAAGRDDCCTPPCTASFRIKTKAKIAK
jgi:hypothetical protein